MEWGFIYNESISSSVLENTSRIYDQNVEGLRIHSKEILDQSVRTNIFN